MVGVIYLQDRPRTSRELERNSLVISRVLFNLEDNIEVEELSISIAAPNSSLPPNHRYVLLYVRTPTNRPSSLGLDRSFPSMTTVGSMASTISAMSMHTLVSVQGGGTMYIPSVTPSTVIFGSTSIPYSSGSSQAVASGIGFFPFGMSTSVIPLVLLSIPSAAYTSMASGSSYFQGFIFRGCHIPHSNPTVVSISFSFIGKSYNPFKIWTNLVVNGLGAVN